MRIYLPSLQGQLCKHSAVSPLLLLLLTRLMMLKSCSVLEAMLQCATLHSIFAPVRLLHQHTHGVQAAQHLGLPPRRQQPSVAAAW